MDRDSRLRRERRFLFAAILAVIALGGWNFHRPIGNHLVRRSTEPVVEHSFRRQVYPYSVIRGGVYDGAELRRALAADPVAAVHYASFDAGAARPVQLSQSRRAYVSFRKDDRIYWTRQPVLLAGGETVLTDGVNDVRARCGNRISDTPQAPVLADEPPAADWEKATGWENVAEVTTKDSVPSVGGVPGTGPLPLRPLLLPADLFAPPTLLGLAGGGGAGPNSNVRLSPLPSTSAPALLPSTISPTTGVVSYPPVPRPEETTPPPPATVDFSVPFQPQGLSPTLLPVSVNLIPPPAYTIPPAPIGGPGPPLPPLGSVAPVPSSTPGDTQSAVPPVTPGVPGVPQSGVPTTTTVPQFTDTGLTPGPTPQPTPEPAPILLMGAALVALRLLRR